MIAYWWGSKKGKKSQKRQKLFVLFASLCNQSLVHRSQELRVGLRLLETFEHQLHLLDR
jgi:hypothetical protein